MYRYIITRYTHLQMLFIISQHHKKKKILLCTFLKLFYENCIDDNGFYY